MWFSGYLFYTCGSWRWGHITWRKMLYVKLSFSTFIMNMETDLNQKYEIHGPWATSSDPKFGAKYWYVLLLNSKLIKNPRHYSWTSIVDKLSACIYIIVKFMTPRTWGSDLINITKNIYFEKNEIYGKKLHVLCEGSMCCWIVFQFRVWLIYRYYLRSLMGRIGLATSITHTYKLTKVVSNTHSFLLLFGVENTFYMTHILQVI